MALLGKILVPVDLSPRSIGAARYAASLGSAFNSELVFVHALRNGWPLSEEARGVRDAIARIQGCRPSRFIIREGAPVAVILDAARTEAVDLILMPTRGAPALSRIFDRSMTAQVLREAECAVWAGVNDLSPLARRRIRTILCGTSLGPRAKAVVSWAGRLARRFRASLMLIHTSKDFESIPSYPCHGEWRVWRKAMAKDEIRQLQEAAGTDADSWLAPGRPQAAIPAIAQCLSADLLVVGKSPPRRVLGDLRTLTYDLVCRAPCPVASV